jgi:hypothetical protein
MNKRRIFGCCTVLLWIFLWSAQPIWADDTLDLRRTRIARISLLEGDVTIQHAASSDWETGLLNLPVITGDLIYTGQSGRAELQIQGAFIRLDEKTSFELVELSPDRYRFDLTSGTITFSLEEDLLKEIEVATPQVSVVIDKAGIYRINVRAGGDTDVIVHKGEAELFSRNGQFKLREVRRASFRADMPLDVEISTSVFIDQWDIWNEERDNLARNNRKSSTFFDITANGTYGISDLDLYGNWINSPGAGWVWRPSNIGAGWAPYRYGRWVSYGWGWTWVSFEPWGWLPYHYGRWVYFVQYGWVWVPYRVDWNWSPALVSWYFVSWNNTNYVCWRPRPVQYYQPPPPPAAAPLAPGTPGQPVHHGGGRSVDINPPANQPIVGGQPVQHGGKPDVTDVILNTEPIPVSGLSFLGETEFVNGNTPQVPTGDIIGRLRDVRPIETGSIPVKPVRVGTNQVPRQLPPPEILERPLVTRGSGNSQQRPDGRPRRDYVVVNPPASKPDSKPIQAPVERKKVERPVPTVTTPPVAGSPATAPVVRPTKERVIQKMEKPAERHVEKPAEKPPERAPERRAEPAPQPKQVSPSSEVKVQRQENNSGSRSESQPQKHGKNKD